MVGVIEWLEGLGEVRDRESGGGSATSRTVGDTACDIALRLVVRLDDIRRSIRLALLIFFSDLSSAEDEEPEVFGGEKEPLASRLDRLLVEGDCWWPEIV
jgi:hypothetical protein